MTELEAIYARHSVRNYQDKKIESEKLDALRALIEKCNAESGLKLQLVEDAGKTFNRLLNRFMGLGSAPSVIACIGPDNKNTDELIGYYGQKVVLLAQTLGLNTCWAGTFNPANVRAERTAGDKLPIVIAIGYGQDGGKPRKSKTAQQVVRGGIEGRSESFMRAVECALLAPTAINQQKFEIVPTPDGGAEIVNKGGILSNIDKGIVKYNFEVGAKLA